MARRTPAAASKTATRGPSATSVKGTEAAAPASPGAGITEALAILSTILLVAAIVMTDYYMGHKLGKSVFFGP